MKKRLAVLVLALGVFVGITAQPAHADNLGTRYINFPDHGGAQLRLRVETWRVWFGPDQAAGSFAITDHGTSTQGIESITLNTLRLWELDAPNGSLNQLAGTPGLPRCIKLPTAPNCPAVQLTNSVACMHPRDFPQFITEGDQVWVTATMNIHWKNGDTTPVRTYSSNVVTFTLSSQCVE